MNLLCRVASSPVLFGLLLCCVPCEAQISFRSSVDLALRNSPRVKVAEADVAKAAAAVSESLDVYVPALSVGAGLGESYGYSPYPPTLFTFTAQSLIYNGSQYSYIRSARAGLRSSTLTLQDAREAVAEDAAVTFAAVDRDQQREFALREQSGFGERLVAIVQDRVSAGLDTKIDLTTAQLTAAQLRLALLKAEDDTQNDRQHLANLVGMPGIAVRAEGGLPALPDGPVNAPMPGHDISPAVTAAFQNAKLKQETAIGDSRYLYRPQVSLVVQYYRYATFTDSFKQIQALNPSNNIGANNEIFGVQIDVPLFNKGRQAKARESAADAAHALHDAEALRVQAGEGVGKLNRTITELRERREVAALEQQLAQQQMDALQVRIAAASSPNGVPVTPKDEQTSHIAEREKYLAVVETNYQLRQAEISLLRQTGRLQAWLKDPANAVPAGTAAPQAAGFGAARPRPLPQDSNRVVVQGSDSVSR